MNLDDRGEVRRSEVEPLLPLRQPTRRSTRPRGSQVWTRVRDGWRLVGPPAGAARAAAAAGSDPCGVVSPEDGVHPWRTWCHLWMYRGLSPVGGCGGCSAAVASGHEGVG